MSEDPEREPGLNGDFFRGLCDHVFWCNSNPRENVAFRHGDVVFCKIDEVWRLFRALRRTRHRIVLVTGEGDKPIDRPLWKRRPPHVDAWFGTNMAVVDEASGRGLPLGLGNRGDSMTAARDDIQKARRLEPRRERLLYANFSIRTNRKVREPLANWLEKSEQGWITRDVYSRGDASDYLTQLCRHHFALCPPGNGEDTHRFWEALYCGAIPVIRRSSVMDHFQGLPFMAVSDLQGIAEKDLRSALDGFRGVSFSSEQLSPEYWRTEFTVAQNKAKAKSCLSIIEWWRGWVQELGAMVGKV